MDSLKNKLKKAVIKDLTWDQEQVAPNNLVHNNHIQVYKET